MPARSLARPVGMATRSRRRAQAVAAEICGLSRQSCSTYWVRWKRTFETGGVLFSIGPGEDVENNMYYGILRFMLECFGCSAQLWPYVPLGVLKVVRVLPSGLRVEGIGLRVYGFWALPSDQRERLLPGETSVR